MSLSEATSTGDDTRAARVRWAAIAAVLAGILTGGALILRPLLDIQLDTPESTAVAIASALGRLLFVVALVGVHIVYGTPTASSAGSWCGRSRS